MHSPVSWGSKSGNVVLETQLCPWRPMLWLLSTVLDVLSWNAPGMSPWKVKLLQRHFEKPPTPSDFIRLHPTPSADLSNSCHGHWYPCGPSKWSKLLCNWCLMWCNRVCAEDPRTKRSAGSSLWGIDGSVSCMIMQVVWVCLLRLYLLVVCWFACFFLLLSVFMRLLPLK